ncbi:MAG TPA: GDP-mannose 4,6-dehydratase [Syntrophobacteraceae bacterium]|nr:GDP-mannose 4,6-dehydratase [Syntrophobacteraceae bacterium]
MKRKMLITGGAGFIGFHSTRFFSRNGWQVAVVDNLSRKGSPYNLECLRSRATFTHYPTDVRDYPGMKEVFRKEGPFDAVLHLAAQVAVTTSVVNPRHDFEVNALGTLNLLECVREHSPSGLFLYASTNKVYGKLEDLPLVGTDSRYCFEDTEGVDENRSLDFHSPYGCSKGCADQYVRDYARIYGLHTVNFRQSCIYGDQQLGVEDQGWVAWFIIAGTLGLPVTVYGDGKQLRDLLWIDDLVRLYALACDNGRRLRGGIYNIGGGYANTLSLRELLAFLDRRGVSLQYGHGDWRPGDQRVFVSDNRKAERELGWKPVVGVEEGLDRLIEWVRENRPMLRGMLAAKMPGGSGAAR